MVSDVLGLELQGFYLIIAAQYIFLINITQYYRTCTLMKILNIILALFNGLWAKVRVSKVYLKVIWDLFFNISINRSLNNLGTSQ